MKALALAAQIEVGCSRCPEHYYFVRYPSLKLYLVKENLNVPALVKAKYIST